MIIDPSAAVSLEVIGERKRQDAKWGEQNHPDLSPNVAGYSLSDVAGYYGISTADDARRACDSEHKHGQGSWFSIHVEELGEALEAAVSGDTVALRAELVQLAATVTAHVEAIDRRENKL